MTEELEASKARNGTEEKMRREEKKKQDAFLEKHYKDKMKEIEDESANDEMDWDPIEDELEDGRGNFIGMFILSPQILHQQLKVDSQEEEQNSEKPRPGEINKKASTENEVESQKPAPRRNSTDEIMAGLESYCVEKL